jgi:hypothetical protein
LNWTCFSASSSIVGQHRKFEKFTSVLEKKKKTTESDTFFFGVEIGSYFGDQFGCFIGSSFDDLCQHEQRVREELWLIFLWIWTRHGEWSQIGCLKREKKKSNSFNKTQTKFVFLTITSEQLKKKKKEQKKKKKK